VDISSFEPHVARALELQIGTGRVVIGLDEVDRIVETMCAPLPMAHALVHGIGFDEHRPIVCVGLDGKPAAGARMVIAVLLAGAGPVAWALCVAQVHGVVPLVGRALVADPRLPRWLSRVSSQDGRTLSLVDGARLVRDIGSAA
jgi:hypothetical protein